MGRWLDTLYSRKRDPRRDMGLQQVARTFLFSQYVEVITKYAGVSSGFWPRGTVDADVYTGIGMPSVVVFCLRAFRFKSF